MVIPAYRAERTIGRAIDSVLASGIKVRIIVVVDGERERIRTALSDYAPNSVSVLVNSTNQGAARSRNRGLREVKSPYVMFLDSDDFVEGPLISGLVDQIKLVSADIALGPTQILHEVEGRREPEFVPRFTSAEELFWAWHRNGEYVGTCSVLWRTNFIQGLGGWDADISRNDDGELMMRALLRGGSLAISTKGRGVYVKHGEGSLSSRSDNLQSMILANEKLLAINSEVVRRGLQVDACAAHYFRIAWKSYFAGNDSVGLEALKRSRHLGFAGSLGPIPFQILTYVLGLRAAARLSRLRRTIMGRRGVILSPRP
ncbi:MAG: glycosyltransferase family A protein [Pseudomonadota bacterium]